MSAITLSLTLISTGIVTVSPPYAAADPPAANPVTTTVDDPDALVKQAEALEAQGSYSGARDLYSQAYQSYKAHHKIKETFKTYLKMHALDKKKDKLTNAAPGRDVAPAQPAAGDNAVAGEQAAPAAADDPDVLMQQAAALEAASKWDQAAATYDKAAKAYGAKGQSSKQAQAYKKSALMYEKQADSLLAGGTAAPAPAAGQTTPAAGNTAPAPDETAPAAAAALPGTFGNAAPAVSLGSSAIVHVNKKGAPAVSTANGKPVNGIKLSRHDSDIHNPSIVVTPNGTIHVAFVERMEQSPFSYSVYHRSSSDGGKTWSAAKNLSEVMPDYTIGNCRIACDGSGRVYVVWRTSFGPNAGIPYTSPHASGNVDNLVYRVFDNGAWSGKAILINNPPVDPQVQAHGTSAWFVSTDPNGKVHVFWNTDPDPRHPEAMTGSGGTSHSPTIGLGEVMEVTLSGSSPTPMREVFMTPINTKVTTDNPQGWPSNDYLDTINGYVDSAGKPHILAFAHHTSISREPTNRFVLIENGKMTPAFELPGTPGDYWEYPPILLVDAQGKRHGIAMYPRGEQPSIRDYVIGSDAEPTVIRAAKEVKGKLEGFQAYQGPGGMMIAVMQMNDTGKDTDDELYISTSSGGGKWSTPVNVTNNTGRIESHFVATSSRSGVARESYWYPGPAAATFDKSGHLVMAYVSKEFTIVDSSAFGVSLAGGSTSTPKLLFLRF